MRHLTTAAIAAIAAIACVLYITPPSGAQRAEPSPAKDVAALQKEVRVLQKHLRALQERTTFFRKQLTWALEMTWTATQDGVTCLAALTADDFQNTWSQVDHLAGDIGAQTIFGNQTAIDDKKTCQGLGVLRPPLNSSVAPNLAPFEAFIRWLHGG